MKSLYIQVPIFIVITVLSFWLRFANLDSINLFNDEYYQYETAASVLETGEYRRYNFYTQEPGVSYTRAKIYTWQIAQSMKLFGVNEFAARLPAVLWGTALVVVLIGVLLRVGVAPFVAYGSGALILFDDFFIGMSRLTRMYSMMFVLTVLILWLLYEAIRLEDSERVNRWVQAVWSGAAVLTTGVLYLIFPELALLLWAGVGAYVVVRAIGYSITKQPSHAVFAWLFIIGAGLSVIGGVVHSLGYHFIPVDAFGFRIQPHLFYIEELFVNLRWPAIGLVLVILGLMRIRSIKHFSAFSTIVTIAILIFFIFFGERWSATRYIGYVMPFVYVLMVSGMYQLAKWIMQALHLDKRYRSYIASAIFVVAGVWVSFPGVPAVTGISQIAYADRTHQELERPNMRDAYAYIIDRYMPGQTVFMQGPRYVYMNDATIPVVELGEYQSLSFDEFVELIYSAEQGGTVVYNKYKARHLQKEIKTFIADYMSEDTTMADTRVLIFNFTPDMLPEQPNGN